MNVLAHILYSIFIGVAVIDVFLVAPALVRAEHGQTVGRLIATVLTLIGLVLSGSGRLTQNPLTFPGLTFAGISIADLGLLAYAVYLPDDGLLALIRRSRHK